MVKTKMSVQDMLTQKHYISIFTLTNEFACENGLQQIHYRYALQEKPDLTEYYQNKMKKFFGNKLEKLFKESDMLEKMGYPRRIYRNCIKKGTHLSYFLNQMVKNGILYIKNNKEGKRSYDLKYLNYFVYPVKRLVGSIKNMTPITIKFFYSGDLNVGNFSTEKGMIFDIDFLKLPEEMFNPEEKQKKEFEYVMNKISDAIFDFGEYVKKVTKPNIEDQKNKKQIWSHQFGIYVNCMIFNKKTHQEMLKITKKDEIGHL